MFEKLRSWPVRVGLTALLVVGLALAWHLKTPQKPRLRESRLILVGLDGLDWTWLDAQILKGKLPHFARLRKEGLTGPLQSLRPLLSPILWTTMATGVGPDRHGVLDFLEVDASGALQPITSRTRHTEAFWEQARRWDRTVGVVNWFGSWPAESVPGWLVSDRLSYHSFFFSSRQQESAGLTWPPELLEELRPFMVEEKSLTPEDLTPYLGDLPQLLEKAKTDRQTARRLEQFRHLVAAARTYQTATLHLMDTRPTDLVAVYLDSFDTSAHLFAPYIPPRQAWIDPQEFQFYQGAVAKVTEDLDLFLGEVMKRLGPRDRLMLVSDHGFRTGNDRLGGGSNIDESLAADWHRDYGVFALFGAGIRQEALGGMTVMDVLPVLCALMGVAPLQEYEGRVPASILEIAQPLPAVPGAATRDIQIESEQDSAAGEVVERLEALGYIGGSPEEAGQGLRSMAYNNLGVYFQKVKRDYPRAEVEFRKAIDADPNDVSALGNLASLHLGQKRYPEALTLLRQVLARRPDLLNARLNLAICLRVLDQLDEARTELRTILAQDPAFQAAWWNLGLSEEKSNRFAEAAEAYEKAAALTAEAEEQGSIWNAAGLMRAQSGDLQRAGLAFQQSMKAEPTAIDPKINLANVEALQGRNPEARRLFEEVLVQEPDQVKALNGLGQLELREGRTEDGRKRLQRSLQLDPGQQRIRQILDAHP